jgi:endonuclease/exonuclease/phosphatase family metal-dependent hydrolase
MFTRLSALRWLLLAGAALFLSAAVHPFGADAPPTGKPSDPPPANASAASGARLTVTFWNLQWFPGRRPNAGTKFQQTHLAAVVPVLERLNPDFLCMEEVADLAAAQSVAGHLKGFRVDVCSQFTLGGPGTDISRQQVALCSRLPLIHAWWEEWKPGRDGIRPTRGFSFAAYRPVMDKVLLVYGTHLKSNRADSPGGEADNIAQREEAARQFLAHQRAMAAAYARMGEVTVMLGGDLNTSLDDPRFGRENTLRSLSASGFRWVWRDIPLASRYTLPAQGRYPAVCFDHVFFRGAGCRLLEAFVEPTGRDCSDHRPVTARIEF